uniref:Rosmarinate synthase n=1 Tax=Glechoma hederacea TaxID=28509 RepID=W0UVQ0_GLEHE|nr:hydroxycinnamoyltransferase 2 [Glechoma hederacea]
MKMSVKESTMVKPMEETPGGSLWLSNVDFLMPDSYHTPSVYFFRHDGSANFFDAAELKAALSRALVHFYPFAGRLNKDDSGRLKINCSGEGVLFVEAECDGALADLADFSPSPHISLAAKVDYSQGISTYPLSLMQLTRFKCGGVSLGVTNEHHVADGTAALHYINTWSDIARGLTVSAPPFLDRRLLAARSPPQPNFSHVEYQPYPSLKTPLNITNEAAFKTFTMSRDHLNAIKEKCNSGEKKTSYTTYEAVAGHVWRCICMARRLPPDQESKVQISVDSRQRLRPPLPERYFGNAIFFATPVALCGELESKPLRFAVAKIHDALARMDDEYMKSALDYLEVEQQNIAAIVRNEEETVGCPNAKITSWVRLPFYEADFGWGKPVFAGLAAASLEGKCHLQVDPENEANMKLSISLLKPHLDLFEKLLYDI